MSSSIRIASIFRISRSGIMCIIFYYNLYCHFKFETSDTGQVTRIRTIRSVFDIDLCKSLCAAHHQCYALEYSQSTMDCYLLQDASTSVVGDPNSPLECWVGNKSIINPFCSKHHDFILPAGQFEDHQQKLCKMKQFMMQDITKYLIYRLSLAKFDIACIHVFTYIYACGL